jgi:hypothetical protein
MTSAFFMSVIPGWEASAAQKADGFTQPAFCMKTPLREKLMPDISSISLILACRTKASGRPRFATASQRALSLASNASCKSPQGWKSSPPRPSRSSSR